MSNPPPHGPYPPYYLPDPSFPPYFHPPQPHAYPPRQPHGYPPPPGHLPPPPPHFHGHAPPPPPHGYPFYLPGAVMIPLPVSTGQPSDVSNPTYITNYIYHGASDGPAPSPVPAIQESEVKVEEFSGEYQWVPATSTTASFLTGRAVVGGHEGWDGSPLWVIRSWHGGELIPGKLSVRHNLATIPIEGKEVTVQNIEVLCAKVEDIRWAPATNGSVPPGAIPGGNTASGETLYIGRARYQLSLTPGKIQPSQNCCYISFSGAQVMHKMYDVLCRSN